MKYCSMNGTTESEVESLLMSPCWGPTQNGNQDQYLLDGHKLLLDHDLDSLPSENDQKNSLDVLDNLLLNTSSLNALSDLKPLPPFTGYTGHLSINGISGHHYHAIAQRLPDESNNNYAHPNTYQTNSTSTGVLGTTTIQLPSVISGTTPISSNNLNGNVNMTGGLSLTNNLNNRHNSALEHNIVSSSTCLPETVLNTDADACLHDIKLFTDSQLDSKLYTMTDTCVMPASSNNNSTITTGISHHGPDTAGVRIYSDAKDITEYMDMNSIDDIAAIIGSAIADTTVTNRLNKEDGNDTRDSWMDLDAWIDGNCIQQDGKLVISQQDSLSDFILPQSPIQSSNSSSTLQNLLTHGYMPLLQNRLQNGPTTSSMKSEASSSTSFCGELPTAAATSTSASPPGSVVSTTDNLILNPRYLATPHQYQVSVSTMKSDGICSPDMINNYPHTTTIIPTPAPKPKRSRTQKKNNNPSQTNSSLTNNNTIQTTSNNINGPQQMNSSITSPASVNFNTNDMSNLLGKEKPVHRCSICNRGFLNKSNIKVHLRTHTGEKPFRCEVCSKAFRQKAHLLKHQQIHKRIGRD